MEEPPLIANPGGNPTNSAASLTQKLIEEFAEQLDPSLIIAIASDRDIVEYYDDIRNDLLPLAQGATAEAATGFDPSGLGHLIDLEALHLDNEAVTSGDGTSRSKSTDVATTVSDSSDGLESPVATFADQASLSNAEKVENLREIFNFAEHTIKFILKQCAGDFERAFEELQNRQYLEEHGELPKGVDGFFSSDTERWHGSDRRRRSSAQAKSGQTQLLVDYALTAPKLDDEELEVAEHSGRGRPGKRAVLSSPFSASSSTVTQSSATRLTMLKSSVPSGSLVKLPKPSPSAWQEVKKKAGRKNTRTEEPTTVTEMSNHNMRAAASLARRGASDPLYRQGVIVFTERAREGLQTARANNFTEAQRQVDATSTLFKIDLHGVSVIDGVKIAKARVRAWWESLGEDRTKKARLHGFTVVTGLGRHSVNGVSRLRQAVFAALKNDGWKVTTLSGQFYITGRA